MKTIATKLFLLFILSTLSITTYSQDYLTIQGRQNRDFRDLGPAISTFEIYGENTLWFNENNDVSEEKIPANGKIGVQAFYSNEQFYNTTDAKYGNPEESLLFGASRSTTAKRINSKDLLVRMKDIATESSFYSPTTRDTDTLNPDRIFGFEQFVSAEELQNRNLPTDGNHYMGDVTYTFTEPVDNPIIHITGLGGLFVDAQAKTIQIWSLEYELETTSNIEELVMLNGTSRTIVEDNTVKSTFGLEDYAKNGASGTSGDDAGSGSFMVKGKNITSVTFKMNMQGKVHDTRWSTPDDYNDGTDPSAIIQQFTGDRFNVTWTLPLYDFGGSVVIDFNQNGTPAADQPEVGTNVNGKAGPYIRENTNDKAPYTTLYAMLADGSSKIVAVDVVSEDDGTFDFPPVLGGDYYVVISSTMPQIGATAPVEGELGKGWTFTEEQFLPNGGADFRPDGKTNVYNVNFENESLINDTNLIFGIQNASLLTPVQLISFEGVTQANDAVLSWSTASEDNNSHFVLERSFDGSNFTTIAEVTGNGTSNVQSDYTYTDVNVGEENTIVYYKLKQVDFDGTIEYSQVIVRVEFDEKAIETSIYPNPVQRGGDVQVEAQEINTIEIYSVDGTLMNMVDVDGVQVYTINTSDLPKGLYIVRVNGKDSKKLIVK